MPQPPSQFELHHCDSPNDNSMHALYNKYRAMLLLFSNLFLVSYGRAFLDLVDRYASIHYKIYVIFIGLVSCIHD